MVVSLTREKKKKLTHLGKEILNSTYIKIRDVAGLIGLMIACTPGVEYGAAHCKAIERDKIKALWRAKGDFEQLMWLSSEGKTDIHTLVVVESGQIKNNQKI